MKHFIVLLALLFALVPCAAAQEAVIDAAALSPLVMTPASQPQIADLYCGPTQGFYRHDEQTIDLGQPFVCFGQYDCWAMVAPGTAESFGPVGWIESGLFDISSVPELAFEDSFAAMVEQTAPMTNDPLGVTDAAWTASLARGAQVIVLTQLGDWIYVQAEIGDTPARVFIPAASIL